MILFLWFKLMMMMLLLVIFVVVMLESSVVIFWLQESSWLCVCRFWPSMCGGVDVVLCVVKGVLLLILLLLLL